MAKKKSPYDVLGVAPTAKPDAVRAAFRRKARKTHPDVARDDGAAFREVHAAYKLLTDDARRARYDASGDDSEAAPDNASAQAVAILTTVFQHVMLDLMKSQKNPENEDVVDYMFRALASADGQFKEQLRDATKTEKFWLKASGRMTAKSKDNVFEHMIRDQLAGVAKAKAHIEAGMAAHAMARDMLNGYTFRHEKVDAKRSGFGVVTGQIDFTSKDIDSVMREFFGKK